MRFVKPIDENLLHHIFQHFDNIITVEDGCIVGGLGSAVLEFMAKHRYHATVRILGVPDRIVEHGKPAELFQECRYDAKGIKNAVIEMLQKQPLVRKLVNHETGM